MEQVLQGFCHLPSPQSCFQEEFFPLCSIWRARGILQPWALPGNFSSRGLFLLSFFSFPAPSFKTVGIYPLIGKIYPVSWEIGEFIQFLGNLLPQSSTLSYDVSPFLLLIPVYPFQGFLHTLIPTLIEKGVSGTSTFFSRWKKNLLFPLFKNYFPFIPPLPGCPCPHSNYSFSPQVLARTYRKTPEASRKTSHKLSGTKRIWENSAGARSQPGMREWECFSSGTGSDLGIVGMRLIPTMPPPTGALLESGMEKSGIEPFAALLDCPAAGEAWTEPRI